MDCKLGSVLCSNSVIICCLGFAWADPGGGGGGGGGGWCPGGPDPPSPFFLRRFYLFAIRDH